MSTGNNIHIAVHNHNAQYYDIINEYLLDYKDVDRWWLYENVPIKRFQALVEALANRFKLTWSSSQDKWFDIRDKDCNAILSARKF